MTLYRGTVIDTPGDPFAGDPADALRAEHDGALLVRDGVIVARGVVRRAAGRAPGRGPVRRPDAAGCCCPDSSTPTCTTRRSGRSAGWACRCWTGWTGARCPRRAGWPTRAYAAQVAGSSSPGCSARGTTTALVFGSHFAAAMDVLFAAAERTGPERHRRLVLSDRMLRADLLTTPERARAEGRALIERWHGQGRLRYAVTPRFSLSASDAMLDVCAELLGPRTGRLVHLAPQREPAPRSPGRATCSPAPALPRHLPPARAGRPRSVFAHNVHATDRRAGR